MKKGKGKLKSDNEDSPSDVEERKASEKLELNQRDSPSYVSKSEPLEDLNQRVASEKNKKAELKAKIESILFCIPEGVTAEVLANKLNLGLKGDIREILLELQQDYTFREGGIRLIQDGNLWKFRIPDEHAELIREAAIPEFDAAVLETLAYIAWRGGSRQCDVVRVRSNKAYNHIKLLKEKGFIESHKSGLSKWLQLTRKFYEYFKVNPGEKLPLPEEVERRLEEAEKKAEELEAAEKAKQEEEKESQDKAAADTNQQ